MTHTENTGVNLQEIFKFIDALKSLGIPVVIEYKQSIPSRLYYRPGECGWTGVALLEKKECGTYLGLLLSEVNGIIDFGMYGEQIREDDWTKLDVNDLDIYIKNAIHNSEFIYHVGIGSFKEGNKIEDFPPFELDKDIALKDYQMIVYLKEKTKAGADIHAIT